MIVGEKLALRRHGRQYYLGRRSSPTCASPPARNVQRRLVPLCVLNLEQALEFCADDECAEVTPSAVRMRKTVLDAKDRFRVRARRSRGE